MKLTLPLTLFASALFLLSSQAHAFNVLSPGDAIIAIDLDFSTGSASPAAEGVANILDGNSATKYLNSGIGNVGFIVTPDSLAAVQSFNITTANDFNGRDPASWSLYGTNDPITTVAHGNGRSENWTQLGMGTFTDLEVPLTRFTTGQAVGFSNANAYSSYKMIYPTTRAVDSIFQVADVGFFASMDGSGTNLLNTSAPLILPIRDVELTPSSNSPANEAAPFVIDRNVNTKYLNFGKQNSGIIVTPTAGTSVLNGFTITTANDADARDPATYELYGTNDTITTPNNGIGNEENWTLISSGALNLPVERLTESSVIPVAGAGEYTSYRMVFPTLRDGVAANSMQIAEVALLAATEGTLTVNRQTGVTTLTAPSNLTFANYAIGSEGGTLNAANWTSITSTNADPNDTWTETSRTDTLLAEEDGPTGSNDGFTVTGGGSGLNLGAIARPVPTEFEGLSATFRTPGGRALGIEVVYTDAEIPFGDYSGNGTVGIEDWPAFRAVYGSNNAGLSAVESYLNGDLDGDFDSDLSDFNLFVAAAGGAAALFGAAAVPEPSTLLLAGMALVGLGIRRSRQSVALVAVVGVACLLTPSAAEAQTQLGFTVVGSVPLSQFPPTTSIPVGQMNEEENSGPDNLLDDDFLNDPGAIDSELFVLDYNDPELSGTYVQYANLGAGPATVFFDYGQSVSANWFAYSQRSGADATADRVGKFEFWFSNTPFADVPATAPDSTLQIAPTDNRLRDSVLRPYTLSGEKSGRYVAMRLTQSTLSDGQPVTNIGGHEFRLLDGPSDVVLEVNRATGALTLKNNLSVAQAIELKSYTIESPSGALDAAAFNGLRGDLPAFPPGNGLGSGWDLGLGSNDNRLAEANYNGVSTLATGVSNLMLGNAYRGVSLAEDLTFVWTNSDEEVYNARVTYVGVAPVGLLGDYNDDSVVDAADYTVWRDNLGSSVTLPNDSTPGTVTEADYTVWKTNYGLAAAPTTTSAAAPEPSSVSLVLLALGALAGRRRK